MGAAGLGKGSTDVALKLEMLIVGVPVSSTSLVLLIGNVGVVDPISVVLTHGGVPRKLSVAWGMLVALEVGIGA